MRSLTVPALAAVLLGQASSPREIPRVPSELLTRPVAIAAGIGHAHDPVGTTSRSAQAFYDQGLAYLHSYVWIEAARAFHQALRVDPSLAIAYAQLSLASTELNAPADARAAIARARALSAKATDHDRRHIDARWLQMNAEEHAGDPAALAAYRSALDADLKAFPGDVELWLLRGNAESPDPADRGQGSPAASIPFYDTARALAPHDDAPVHDLTHAYENSRDAARALVFSEAYAKAAPAIPHAHHMHGHVLLSLGRVADATSAFEAADRVERDYLARAGVPAEYEWHHEHNLDLLGASYAYAGRMHAAEKAMKEAFDLPTALAVQAFNKRNYPALLTSLGRYDAAHAAAAVLIGHPSAFGRVAGRIEDARAFMAEHQTAKAAAAINAALDEMRASPPAGGFAAIPFALVQGEILVQTGQRARGESLLRDGVRKLRMLTGPDAHMDAIFTLDGVARAMREAGAWDLATWAASQMMAYDSRYAGAHFATALALEHAGNAAAARQAFATAARLWSSADADLPDLRIATQNSR